MACWISTESPGQPINLLGAYHRHSGHIPIYTQIQMISLDVLLLPIQKSCRKQSSFRSGVYGHKFDPLIDVMGKEDPRETPIDRLQNGENVVRAVREALGAVAIF